MNIITNSHRALAEKSVSEQLNQMSRTVKAYLQVDSEEANEELTTENNDNSSKIVYNNCISNKCIYNNLKQT
jgi:hypothetical protein